MSTKEFRPYNDSEPNGLELFLHQLGQLPLLSAEQERDLAFRIAGGDQEARTMFIERNLRLVVNCAKHATSQLPLEDLIQAGVLGLIKAVEHFDYQRGYRFSTYAIAWIRQAIQRWTMENEHAIRFPVHVMEQIKMMRSASIQFQTKHGREPEPEELARFMGKSETKIRELLSLVNRSALSLDQSLNDMEEEVSWEIADAGEDTEEMALQHLDQELVQGLLSQLSMREADIVRRRFGIAPYASEQTLETVSFAHGITKERARQLEKRALATLKSILLEQKKVAA